MRLLLVGLLLALIVTTASAGEFVQVAGGSEAAPVKLPAYVARPPGPGPHSAVVLVHGCGGFHSSMISWADRLARFGHVALAVDSFGPRGIDDDCNGAGIPWQVGDAYAGLRHLSGLAFVRADRVALMGFSQGGWSVLEALEKGGIERQWPQKFRAGVALYPVCQFASGLMTAPVLVLIGSADSWTPAADCEAMAAGRTVLGSPRPAGDRSAIELIVYPGAHHGFDLVDLSLAPGRGVLAFGHRVEFNEDAMRDSMVRVREFLKKRIAVD